MNNDKTQVGEARSREIVQGAGIFPTLSTMFPMLTLAVSSVIESFYPVCRAGEKPENKNNWQLL